MKIAEKLVAKNNDIYGKAAVTIAFLGDSVTQGCFECYMKTPEAVETVFDSQNAASTKLKNILNYLCPAAQINIINAGISGDHAVNGDARFERDIAPYHPDLVVVGYGLNDCGRGETWKENYKAALTSIFKKAAALDAECIFLTPNLMNDHVSPHLKEELLRNLAVGFAGNGKMLDAYVEVAKEAVRENGVVLCDVYAKWKALQAYGVDTTELLSNKLNHPTREMNGMTAMMIAEKIFEA